MEGVFSQKWRDLRPLRTGMEGENSDLYIEFGPVLTVGNQIFQAYAILRETGLNQYETIRGDTGINIRDLPLKDARERITREAQRKYVLPTWVYEKESLSV